MKNHKVHLGCLLLIAFISFLGIALPYPMMAPLFLSKTSSIQFLDTAPEFLYGIATAGYPLGQFCGAPMLGVISDHSGRKYTLVVSLIMTCVGYLLSIVALSYCSFILFTLSRFFTGFWEGILPVTRAAAADLQHVVTKTKSFGYINAAATSGFLFGPIIGGILADKRVYSGFNPGNIFWFAFILTILALLVLIFFYQDIKVDNLIDKTIKNRSGILEKLKITWSPIRQPIYFSLIMMSTFITLGFDIYYQFYPLFLVKKWAVTPYDIALATVWLSVAMIITQVFIIKYINKLVKVKNVIAIACTGFSICIYYMPFIDSYHHLMFIFCLLGLCIGLIGTNLPVFISDLTPKNMQGQIMGLMMSLRFLGDGIMCLIGGAISSISIMATFVIASIFVIVGMLMFIVISSQS